MVPGKTLLASCSALLLGSLLIACGSDDGDSNGNDGSGGNAGSGASGTGGIGANSGQSGSGGRSEGGAGASGTNGSGGSGGQGAPCTDVAPSAEYTCAQQAGWGKCGEDWMQGFCDASCERCVSDDGYGVQVGSGGEVDPNCGVSPANPNATLQAKKLLCYLYAVQTGKQILSGQQETSWFVDPEEDMAIIHEHTGKYPAIRGLDYLYGSQTRRAMVWWNAGGIPSLMYHMGSPVAEDTYDGSKATGASIDATLTAGSAQNVVFMERLDRVAGELKRLQDANVAVLWRPFHEADGGWFWWSMEGGAGYVKLWKFMFEYFTEEKQLNNLIWMLPFARNPAPAYFPGKAYVDIAGADTYYQYVSPDQQRPPPFTELFNATRTVAGTSIPLALHETDILPQPSTMFGTGQAGWVLFNLWAAEFLREHPVPDLQSAYAHESTITLDEVANLK